MKNKKIITVAVILLIAAIAAGAFLIIGDKPDGNKASSEAKPEPTDILMPKNTTYVTEKNETSVTVEGYITTPAEENPVPESLDDPDFVYPSETVTYIYKSHSHRFDEEGNLYILIEHDKTTDTGVTTEFKITIEDEAIADCPGIYLECNEYIHKVW